MPKQLVLATGNAHKVIEVSQILNPWGFEVISATEAGGMPDVVEDAGTFAGNASKKALACARFLNRIVLADDSGLEVMALNGEPGVYSARYAGEGGNDGRNIVKLLGKLEGITDRRARFVCTLAVASPEGIIGIAEGEVRGTIALHPSGQGGFGYDPVFIPEGYTQSFGELPQDVKNRLSHRANALKSSLDILRKLTLN